MSTQEHHHTTLSELGFTIQMADLPYLNEYPGDWALTGPEEHPENYWIVTFDGNGHPVSGHMSPQEMMDWGIERGWQCAYVAPYGRHVIGRDDGIQLHDWLRDRRHKAHEHQPH